ncbi:MAG: transposase [Patescibacteria group bacterium]|nr:transposase [Patescibacteria group bacterium]
MTQRRIYQNIFPYFVTFNTKNNYPFFADTKKAKLLYKIVLISSKKKFFLPYIFSILNNHIHMLVKFIPALAAAPALFETAATAGRSEKNKRKIKNAATTSRSKYNISDLMHAVKSYYCYQLRNQYNIFYSPWHTRFNFRIINTPKRLRNTINYIKYNYKKHNLSKKYSKQPYQYINEDKINELFF